MNTTQAANIPAGWAIEISADRRTMIAPDGTYRAGEIDRPWNIVYDCLSDEANEQFELLSFAELAALEGSPRPA